MLFPQGSPSIVYFSHSSNREAKTMAGPTTPSRIRLAQLLQEAHETQKYNTRRVEESYHALRTSNRRLELCWTNYCNELERELGVKNWKDIARDPASIETVGQYPPDSDTSRIRGDKYSDMPSPNRSSRHHPISEPPALQTRPQSTNPQTHQHQQPSPNVHGPRGIPESTHTFPSRYNTAPSSRQKPAPSELQGPRPVPASEINMPNRRASLPTREFLVALSTSRPEIPYHHEQRNNDGATERYVVEVTPPSAWLGDVQPRGGNANHGNADYHRSASHHRSADHHRNASHHRSADHHDSAKYQRSASHQGSGKPYTVEAFETPMSHEALSYESGVQGHWGRPSHKKNTAQIEDQGSARKHRSGERERLHKKRY
ncbi:hypothetical protein XANCAGTX0491_000317 [Xanthoria calcicola]